ncbi:MAG: RNase adapter RapZ [Tissierellia bacterium]|nr:RNase adapter RapZ [Tissierellia bacterium]
MDILLITGMSGAGKSKSLKIFEDLGYYCMDNLPPALLDQFTDLCITTNKKIEKIAIVIDTRGGVFFEDFFEEISKLSEKDISYKILYLDASDKVLVKRFKELRRPHPLSIDGSLTNGIEAERERLLEVKKRADYIVDTSKLTDKQLKQELINLMSDTGDRRITVSVVSFGFKNGILIDADLVFDVRFLPNPFYIEDLKDKDGLNNLTKEYIFSWPQTEIFINKTMEMLEFLLPFYVLEGKTQLVVGIGCTGGFHRSVSIANEICSRLTSDGHRAILSHRDKK